MKKLALALLSTIGTITAMEESEYRIKKEPLIFAATNGLYEVCAFLLERDAQVNRAMKMA